MIALFFAPSLLLSTSDIAVIGLGAADRATIAPARRAMASALSVDEMHRRLTGTPQPHTPDEKGLRKMLEDARQREARYDTTGANAMRLEILRAFDICARPSKTLRQLAATAAHDRVAALLGEGDRDSALAAAREAARRFGEWPVDEGRHPPVVRALFSRARADIDQQATGTLIVIAEARATVIADGSVVGEGEGEITITLPPGQYRVWLSDTDDNLSLPYAVDIGDQPTTLTIDKGRDQRIQILPELTIACETTCVADLRALGARLGVASLVAVRPDGTGLRVDVASGTSEIWRDPTTVSENLFFPETRPQFSPWYVVPFGVGQLSQDRLALGITYGLAQVGLLVWHVVSWQRHGDAVGSNDYDEEPSLRAERNLSAILFYSSLAASVVEAVIVGIVTGD